MAHRDGDGTGGERFASVDAMKVINIAVFRVLVQAYASCARRLEQHAAVGFSALKNAGPHTASGSGLHVRHRLYSSPLPRPGPRPRTSSSPLLPSSSVRVKRVNDDYTEMCGPVVQASEARSTSVFIYLYLYIGRSESTTRVDLPTAALLYCCNNSVYIYIYI